MDGAVIINRFRYSSFISHSCFVVGFAHCIGVGAMGTSSISDGFFLNICPIRGNISKTVQADEVVYISNDHHIDLHW